MKKIVLPFICSILILSAVQVTAQGFTGYYNPANWTIELPDPTYGGSVPVFDANTLVIIGPDGEFCLFGEEVSASIAIAETGMVFFDWDFANYDVEGPDWDFFIVRQQSNGDVDVLKSVTETSSGSFYELFSAGDILFLVVWSLDCEFGSGQVTITNFMDPPVPVPFSEWALYLSILLMITFVVIRFRRMN